MVPPEYRLPLAPPAGLTEAGLVEMLPETSPKAESRAWPSDP